MSVVIGYEEAGPWRKKLTIEVPVPAVEAETGRVVKELGRSLRLPGFRKGKVPASLVRKRFSGEIERQVAERLVPRYWHQAEAEKSLDTLSQPQIEDVHFEPGAAMTFVALVETRPEIELKNIDDFSLPEGDVEPREEEVAQALVDLRRQYASWKEVDRGAATGDVVLGRVFETPADAEDGAEGPPASAESRPLRIEIGAEGADEELSLALTGLKAGQSTVFRPREGSEGGKEFRLEVTAVEEVTLPELDDALAAKVGDFADVAALREAVAERLKKSKEEGLRRQREQALLEQLRERHPMELPNGVVDREVDEMLREQAAHLSAQGVDLENTPIDWESMAAQLRPRAQKRVHNRLLLDAVAKAKNVKLDEQEFERFLAGIAREQKKSSLVVRQELDASGRLQALRAQLLGSQTLRRLMGEEVPAAAQADADQTDETESSPTGE